jgi:hypothetical protein
MRHDNNREVVIFAKALAVCCSALYSARTGDASPEEIEYLLESTGENSLIALTVFENSSMKSQS